MDESKPIQPVQPLIDAVAPKKTASGKAPESPVKPTVPPRASPPEDKKEGKKCKPDQTPWWKIVLETAVVLVGVYVATIYSGQLGQMIESNKITREALETVQRAFVFPGTPQVTRSIKKTTVESVILRFSWINSGTTPTRNMTTHISYGQYPNGLPPNFDFPDGWSSKDEATHINTPIGLGPHGDAGVELEPFPAQDIKAIQLHKTKVFIWGWARYHDIFKNTPEHVSEVCYELVGFHGDPLVPSESGGVILNNCATHNCFDSECSANK